MSTGPTKRRTLTATVRGASSHDAFFRRVVMGMRCGIITVDQEGRVITANDLAREILEIHDEDTSQRPVKQVLAHHPRLAEVLMDSLTMSHLPNRAEMEIRSREEDGRTIGFTISTIEGDDGAADGVAMFFKDLTQVERLEEQERLRDRLVAIGQMAANLAHEIRNPLAAIGVQATLLKRRLCGREDELRAVEKIASEVERLNNTVTQALQFARVLRPDFVAQPVAPLLDKALDEALACFPDHQIDVDRFYAGDAPDAAIDENLVRQLFSHLIVNAIEAMERRGKLVLQVSPVARPVRPAAAVEVLVRDSGPGIPAEIREKIFSPFITTKKTGSGFGLATARKIVECHHGVIDVETAAGAGTTFRVRLPREPLGKNGD